jgi:hypothetical protein
MRHKWKDMFGLLKKHLGDYLFHRNEVEMADREWLQM